MSQRTRVLLKPGFFLGILMPTHSFGHFHAYIYIPPRCSFTILRLSIASAICIQLSLLYDKPDQTLQDISGWQAVNTRWHLTYVLVYNTPNIHPFLFVFEKSLVSCLCKTYLGYTSPIWTFSTRQKFVVIFHTLHVHTINWVNIHKASVSLSLSLGWQTKTKFWCV